MTRSALTKTTMARNVTGVNLTDLSYTALTPGTNNGKTWAHLDSDVILLKNGTAGDAVYTFIATVPAGYSTFGATMTSGTITIAAGVTQILRVNEILKDSDGLIKVDCDVAGSIAVLNQT